MKYLIAFLLLASEVQAQSHPFKLVVVRRPDITAAQQIELFYAAIGRLREVKSSIKVTAIIETEDVIKRNAMKDYVNRLFAWDEWAARQKIKTPSQHIHFLLPPVEQGGVRYGGGVSGAICTTTRNQGRKFSYSIMRLKNDSGQSRVEASIMTALHEVLHNLGANHIDSKPNVMRSYYTPGPQPIFPLTKREVEYCKQGKSPKGRRVNRLIVEDPQS